TEGSEATTRLGPMTPPSAYDADTSPYEGGGKLHQEDAFAVGLLVEQLVGFVRLVERPFVGEQAVDVDPALDAERGALGLDDVREGPGGQQGDLPPQQVRADIDRHVAAFADE